MKILTPEESVVAVGELRKAYPFRPIRRLSSLLRYQGFSFVPPTWSSVKGQDAIEAAGFEPYIRVTEWVFPNIFVRTRHYVSGDGALKVEVDRRGRFYIATVFSDGSGVTSRPSGSLIGSNTMRETLAQTGSMELDLETHRQAVEKRALAHGIDVLNFRGEKSFREIYWTHGAFRSSVMATLYPVMNTLILVIVVIYSAISLMNREIDTPPDSGVELTPAEVQSTSLE